MRDRGGCCAGTPEGVIAAAALKCMGGSIQGRLYPRNEEEAKAARERGYDVTSVRCLDFRMSASSFQHRLQLNDLASDHAVIIAVLLSR